VAAIALENGIDRARRGRNAYPARTGDRIPANLVDVVFPEIDQLVRLIDANANYVAGRISESGSDASTCMERAVGLDARAIGDSTIADPIRERSDGVGDADIEAGGTKIDSDLEVELARPNIYCPERTVTAPT
jgi:hypothetical protein